MIEEQNPVDLRLVIRCYCCYPQQQTNLAKLQWSGPYKIIKKVDAVDYEIEMPGRRQERKIYDVNLMKQWHVWTSEPQAVLLATDFEPHLC